MRKPIELNYVKKNGMLYPDLQISNDVDDDKQPIGKYGMMWLKFMQEWHNDRYIELRMYGSLLAMAHRINYETYDMIKWQSNFKTSSIDRLSAESAVIRDFVLQVR